MTLYRIPHFERWALSALGDLFRVGDGLKWIIRGKTANGIATVMNAFSVAK
jgi:hypothetical protein